MNRQRTVDSGGATPRATQAVGGGRSGRTLDSGKPRAHLLVREPTSICLRSPYKIAGALRPPIISNPFEFAGKLYAVPYA